MWFFRRRFRSNRGKKEDRTAFVPSDNLNEQILSCVFLYICLVELSEQQKGREVKTISQVGPITTRELDVIQNFRKSRGYEYPLVENVFWSSEFVQEYCKIPYSQKKRFLEDISQEDFLNHVETGRASRQTKEADGVVYYLSTIPFAVLGLEPDQFVGG